VLTLAMIIVPSIATYLYTRGIEDSDRAFRAGAAFGMTFGLIMLAIGAFSWLASLIMSAVTFIFARHALRSAHGRFLVIANFAILVYGIFFISQLIR
jgi:hypothetical protein